MSNKIRKELCKKIAYMWRYAENDYLATGSDVKKWEVIDYKVKQKLNDKEKKLTDDIISSMGC